jgi:hypothetical protein
LESRKVIYRHYPHFSDQLGRPAGVVRESDYKLVENYESGEVELYNLKNDISESVDLLKTVDEKTDEIYKLLVN